MKSMSDENSSYVLIDWQEPSTIFYLNRNAGRQKVLIGSTNDFANYLTRKNAVIAVTDSHQDFETVIKNIPDAFGEKIYFHVVEGFDYVRARRVKAYVTSSRLIQ